MPDPLAPQVDYAIQSSAKPEEPGFVFTDLAFERIASMDDEPVAFSLEGMPEAFIERAIAPAIDEIESLIEASERGDKCDLPLTAARRDALRKAYATNQQRVYRVRTAGQSEHDAVHSVLVFPNAMGYQSIDEARDDFDICAVGIWSVHTVTRDWIVSTRGCGGASDFGEECDAAEHAVKTTLEIR